MQLFCALYALIIKGLMNFGLKVYKVKIISRCASCLGRKDEASA